MKNAFLKIFGIPKKPRKPSVENCTNTSHDYSADEAKFEGAKALAHMAQIVTQNTNLYLVAIALGSW